MVHFSRPTKTLNFELLAELEGWPKGDILNRLDPDGDGKGYDEFISLVGDFYLRRGQTRTIEPFIEVCSLWSKLQYLGFNGPDVLGYENITDINLLVSVEHDLGGYSTLAESPDGKIRLFGKPEKLEADDVLVAVESFKKAVAPRKPLIVELSKAIQSHCAIEVNTLSVGDTHIDAEVSHLLGSERLEFILMSADDHELLRKRNHHLATQCDIFYLHDFQYVLAYHQKFCRHPIVDKLRDTLQIFRLKNWQFTHNHNGN